MSNILAFLQNQRQGDCADELSAAIAEVAQAVSDTGKPGEVILKIKIGHVAKSGGAVTTEDVITKKLPKTEADRAIFFLGDDGTLQRNNPRQKEFDLKPVDGGKQPEAPAQQSKAS